MIPYFLAILAVVGLLGGVLLVLVLRSKVVGGLKKFLLLAGGSVVGFFVCVLLHNFLYALAVLTEPISALHRLFEFLHAAFFLIAILVCPLGFLTGLIGSIFQLIKQHPKVLTK